MPNSEQYAVGFGDGYFAGYYANKWRGSDETPSENGRYLVCLETTAPEDMGANYQRITILRYLDEWKMPVCIDDAIEKLLTRKVLYWMPIPKLPQEVEE